MHHLFTPQFGQRVSKLQRWLRHRFWVILLLVGFIGLCFAFTPWSVRADEPSDIVAQVWQRVRQVGAYEFRADITQHVVPVAGVINAGRTSEEQNLHIEGSTDLATQAMAMTLWSQGGNVLDRASGLELKVADGRLLARKDGSDWQEISNFTDSLMPQGDFTTFLAGATDIIEVQDTGNGNRDTEGATRYTYRIDGPTFAAHLRERTTEQMVRRGELPPNTQIALPKTFTEMQGTGELWVRADGLPLRQVSHLKFPEQDGQWVAAELDVTFAFAAEATPETLTLVPTLTASINAALQNPDHPLWQTVLLSVMVTLGGGLALFLIVRRRSVWVYRVLSTVVIITMVGGPLAQIAYAEVAYTRFEARQAHQSALTAQAEAMQSAPPVAGLENAAMPSHAALALIRSDNGANRDGDQWSDVQESLLGANPLEAEAAPSGQESALFSDLMQLADPTKDSDGDGLNDYEEDLLGTNPENADTDRDTITDTLEIQGFTHGGQTWHTDPTEIDSNGDGVGDRDEWNSPELLHPTWDTDNDGEPDLFDRDNDGDKVPDSADVSPFRTWSTVFNAAAPFELVVDGLVANKPTFVELQLRPTNPDHLWYTLNELDWPADEGGNLRDLNNSPDDVNLIPMLEVLIPGAPYNLPLATATVDLTIPSSARFGATPITGTVTLTQTGDNIAVKANLTRPSFLEIWQGRCDALLGRASNNQVTIAGTANGTIALNDFTQLKLRDRATGGFVLLVIGDGLSGCTPLPQLAFEGDQMIDTAQMEPYGISVREAAADRVAKLLYVPLNLVADDPANLNGNSGLPATEAPRGGRVAFSAILPYQAAGSWPLAHQAKMVWTVQMKTDKECPEAANCSDYYDIPTVIHTYDDAWTLTGIDVREENGVNLALVYEDPAVDDNLTEDIHLATLAESLGYNFLVGRATEGQLDITVAELARRVNRATNTGVTEDERWGTDNVFNVETYSYPALGLMVRDSIDRAKTILNSKFTPVQAANPNLAPLLLQVGENTYRVLNSDLESKNDAVKWDAGGRKLTVSFNVGNAAPLRTTATVRWQPYQYDTATATWKNYEMAAFWQLLERRYAPDIAAGGEDLHAGDLRLTQLMYLVLTNGLHQTVKLGDKPLTGQSKQDKEIRTIMKATGAVFKVVSFVPNKILKARLNEGVKPIRELFKIAAIKERGDWLLANERSIGRLLDRFNSFKFSNALLLGGVLFAGAVLVTTWALSIANIFVKNNGLAISAAVLNLVSAAYFNVYIPIVKGLNEAAKAGKTATILGLTDKLGSIKNAKIWGAAAAAITIGVAWGYFIYQAASGNIRPGSVAFGNLLAFTIATTIVALIFLAISQIPIFGQIIAGIIAIIDAILTIICEAGVKELRGVVDKASDSCFTLSGALAEFLAKAFFQSDVIFDFESDDFLPNVLVPPERRFPQIKDFGMDLGRPTAGQTVGNTIQFRAKIGGTLPPSKPKGGVSNEVAYDTDTIRQTGITAEFGPVKRDITATNGALANDYRWVFTPRVNMQLKSVFTRPPNTPITVFQLYNATVPDQAVQTRVITLTRPGINATYMTPVYLNIGLSLPVYSCVLGNSCKVAEYAGQSLSDPIIEGKNFALDILPATLDGFFARNWGKTGGGSVEFAVAPDFDGDGLRKVANGGLDPDDAKYDTDADGLPDNYELEYRSLGVGKGGGQISATQKDTDSDGICDPVELQLGSRPDLADTDGDGLADGVEVYHPNCTSGVWEGGWIFTYNTSPAKTLRVSSDPKATDGDQDGMSDLVEKQLHAANPGLYPFHPDVFNNSPVGVLGALNDDDRVVKPGDTVVYTGTVVNNLEVTLWATGTLQTAFPAGTGAAARTDRFLVAPQGAQAFPTTLNISGGSQKNALVTHNLAASLLTSQAAPSIGAAGIAFDESYAFTIDNDQPASQLTSGQYVQAGGFRTIGGTATDPTSYVQAVDVRVVGQTNFERATGAGAWAYTWAVPAGDGRFEIQSQAIDAVGFKENPPASTIVLVDATPPNLTSGQPGNPILPAKRDADFRWTLALNGNVADPSIAGNPGSGVKEVEVLVEPRKTGWQKATLNGGAWSISYPLSPFDADNNRINGATGQYTVTVRALDNVENRTAEANYLVYQVRVDTTPPTAKLVSVGDKETTNGNTVTIVSTPFITRSVLLTGTATDLGNDPGGFASGVQALEIAFTPAELLDTLEAANTLYYLNEPAGLNSYEDASGNNRTGVCNADRCPTNDVVGIFGSAAQFDGGNDVITATVDISETNLSVSLWFNTTNPNGGLFAATSGAIGAAADRSLYLVNGNVCAFVQGAQSDEICTAGQNYSNGQWHQAVLVLAPGSPFRLYIDGQLGAAAGLVSSSTLTAQNGLALGYARTRSGADSYLNGRLDEVEIYPAGLNAAAVASLYRRWQPVTLANPGAVNTTWSYQLPNDLEGYYQIDIRSQDAVGNRNDEQRSLWRQWRGLIDTAAPRVSLVVNFNGNYDTAQTTYNIKAEDFSLTNEGYAGSCALRPEHYVYDTSAFWQEFGNGTPHLQGFNIACTVNDFAPSSATATVCDAYGRCTTASESRDMLYWSTTQNGPGISGIRRANLNAGYQREELFNNLPRITGLDVDNGRGHLYWLERDTATTGRIRRSNLDGTNATTLPISPAPAVSQITFPATFDLVVNPTGGKLYWSEENKIQWANLDGSGVATLFTLPTGADPQPDRIGSMVVDSANGKIYFSAIDLEANNGDFFAGTQDSQIWVMNADGSNPQVLVGFNTLDNVVVVKLALSQDKTRLYWTQRLYLTGPSSAGSGFFSIPTSGGTPTAINVPDANNITFISTLEVSPAPENNPRYAYWSISSLIRQVDLTTGAAGFFAAEPALHLIGGSAIARIPGLSQDAGNLLAIDLELRKGSNNDIAISGGTLDYPVTVRNNGPINASNVTVVYALPAGTTFVPGGSAPECSSTAANQVTCTLAQLADSAERALNVQVQVSAGAGSTLAASAVASSNRTERKPENNSVTFDETRVFAPPPPGPTTARYLYWGLDNQLFRLKTDGSSTRPERVVSHLAFPNETIYGVAADSVNGTVYFSTQPNALTGTGSIRRIGLDSTVLTTIYTDNTAPWPFALALDVENNHLYFTAGDSIKRINLDGSGETTIINNIAGPTGLAINPLRDELYWSDSSRRLLRAELNGANPQVIQDGVYAFNITVDPYADAIYYRTESPLVIYRIQRNGDGLTILINGTGYTGPALDVANNKFYWIDGYVLGDIFEYSLGGPFPVRRNENATQIGTAGAQISSQLALAFTDAALIPTPTATATNTPIPADTPTPIPTPTPGGPPAAENFFWSNGGGEILRAPVAGCPDRSCVQPVVTPSPGTSAGDLVIDSLRGKVYWVNPVDKRIQRSNLDGSNPQTIISGLTDPLGITLDEENARLYWTNFSAGTIQSAALDGTGVITIATGLANPVWIDFAPRQRVLYFIESAQSPSVEDDRRIRRINVDGTGLVNIYVGDPRFDIYFLVTGLAVNEDLNRIYWSDAENQDAYFSNVKWIALDGTGGWEAAVSGGSNDFLYGVTFDRNTFKLYWSSNDDGLDETNIFVPGTMNTVVPDIIRRGFAEGDVSGQPINDLIVYSTPNPTTQPLQLALQYPSPTPPICPVDSSEPNDAVANAAALTVGTPLTNRNFHTISDEDWYVVTLTGGLRYVFDAQAAGSDADTLLELYAADGTRLLASNDNVAVDQLDSQISFDAPFDGAFAVRVRNLPVEIAQLCNTAYSLSVAEFAIDPIDAEDEDRLLDDGPPDYVPPLLDSVVLTPTTGTAISSLAATTVQGAAYANVGIASLAVTLNGAAFYNVTPGGGITQTTWSQAWTPAAEGSYVFNSTVTDSSSRVQTVTRPITVFVDLAAPQVTLDRTTFTSTHLVTGSILVNLMGAATDSLGVALVEVNVENSGWQPARFSNNAWQLGLPFAQTSGQPVQVRVTDLAGKTTVINATLTVDTLAPEYDHAAIQLLQNGTPISTTKPLSLTNPTLAIRWPSATDASGVRGYYVGWTTSPTPNLADLTFYGSGGEHTQTLGEGQIVYAHVVAVDNLGNAGSESVGPLYIDGPATPDLIDDLGYVGWHETGGSQVAADRETSNGPFVGSSFGVVQKFYLSWNDRNLRLSWTGANWDNDGDLFIYLDTTGGGATTLYNPYGDGTNIALPSGMGADFVIWVQDRTTATLLQGGSWNTLATLDSSQYRFRGDQAPAATELLLPFSLLGIDNNAALGVLAVASEEDGLRLWAAAPDHNPLNSERAINPQAAGRTLDNFALTLHHRWPNLNLGQVPNAGRFADSDLVVTVKSLWPSTGAGFLASDLLDLLKFNTPLDGNGDGVPDLALPGSANVPPVGNGLTVQYQIHYANNGPATAPNVNLNLTGSGALSVQGGAVNLGDVAAGASGVVTVTATVGSGAFAELLATVSDGPHGVYDFWQHHHPADDDAPTAVTIVEPASFATVGFQTVVGTVDDASAVPTIALEVRLLPGGATNTINCTDLTPDDGLWSCGWDAGTLAGVDTVELRATATDRYGNVSAVSPVVTLAVDVTAPSVVLSTETEAALADGYINAAEAGFTGQVIDNRNASAVEICAVNTTIDVPVCEQRTIRPRNQPTGDWTLTLATNAEDGETRSLSFAGVDGAGNSAVAFTRTFQIDVVAPVITATRGTTGTGVLGGIIRDGGAVAQVYVRITPPTGVPFWELATLTGESWIYTPTFGTIGVYSLIVEGYDVAGNASAIGPFVRNVLTPATGTIQLVKNTVNGDGLFAFTSTDSDLDAISINTTGGTGTSAVLTKPAGSYIVSEDGQVNWSLTNLTCSGDSDTGSLIDLANRQVTIDLDSGEAIICTFTNTTATGNQAPVAVDDGLPTTSEIVAAGRITLTTLLDNDSDPDDITPADGNCTNCSIVAVGQASQGTVTLVGPSVTYLATNPTFRGADVFTYTLSDNDARGALTDTAQVAVTVQADAIAGDCNADGVINAGDLTALGLEIFDGDGNRWYDAGGGTVAFSGYGCDANADAVIDAGDLTCTARRIFDNAFVCGSVTTATASPATLAVGADLLAQPGDSVAVPIVLTTSGHGVAAAAFSLHWDAAQLQFDASDANADGRPDAVQFHLPAGLLATATYHPAASRLDVVVLGIAPPFVLLADGPLATVRLTVPAGSSGASPRLTLSTASLGSDTGQSIPLTVTNGTVQLPTNTFQLLLPLVSR